jgi:hypothetical protein
MASSAVVIRSSFASVRHSALNPTSFRPFHAFVILSRFLNEKKITARHELGPEKRATYFGVLAHRPP